MSLIYRIKTTISEPYRIKNGFGLRPIRNERELKALIQFCYDELNNSCIYGFPVMEKHTWVYVTTIQLYKNHPMAKKLAAIKKYATRGYYKDGEYWGDVYDFIEDNCGYYWS